MAALTAVILKSLTQIGGVNDLKVESKSMTCHNVILFM